MLKKKLLMGVLCIAMAAVAVGCGSKKEDKEETTQTEDQTQDVESAVSKIKYDVDDYVKLGKYKGVEVAKEEAEVTDEELTTAIDNILQSNQEVVKSDKQVVEDKDTVNIDYEGLLDGVAFEGGTAQGSDLEIGSDSFIDGFEDQLIGAKVGETKSIKVTFPEDYGNETINGKEVTFNVKINYIGEKKVPELTAEVIKSYSGKDMTVDEFKAELKSQLLEDEKTNIESNKIDAVKTKVLETSTVDKFPKGLIKAKISDVETAIKQQAASEGLEFSDYLSQYYSGMTVEQFNEQIEASVEERMTLLLVTEAITKKEDLELTDKEYQAKLEVYAGMYYSTAADFEKQNGKEALEEEFQLQKTWGFVADEAKEK